jgi:hypothetical protein
VVYVEEISGPDPTMLPTLSNLCPDKHFRRRNRYSKAIDQVTAQHPT